MHSARSDCGRSTPPPSSDGPGTGESRTQRSLPWKPVNLRRHACALGVRVAALVSLVAGGDAGADLALADTSLDLLAALRRPVRLWAAIRGCRPPMLRDSPGRETRADLGCRTIPHVFPTAR